MGKLLDIILKGNENRTFKDDLQELRARRVPSKLKREMRRKYAIKHSKGNS